MAMLEIEIKKDRDIHQMLGQDGCFARSRIIGQVIEPPICSMSCISGCEHYSDNPGCKLYNLFARGEVSIEEIKLKLASERK